METQRKWTVTVRVTEVRELTFYACNGDTVAEAARECLRNILPVCVPSANDLIDRAAEVCGIELEG
jgi:hypothetical protein